jgi:hypothetical protein
VRDFGIISYDTKSMGSKRKKLDKWVCIKVMHLLLYFKGRYEESEKTNHRMGENTCNYKFDKEIVCRLYKEFLQLNNKKT